MQEKKNCPELIRIFAQKIRIKDRFFKFLATRTNEMFGIPWNINGFSGSQGLQRNYVLSSLKKITTYTANVFITTKVIDLLSARDKSAPIIINQMVYSICNV